MKTTNPFKRSTKQLSVFVTAGFPEIDSLAGQISLLQEQGIDFIEIGIPFSDPLADGPTIQKSSDVALKNGMTMELLFQQLEQLNDVRVPLVLMGYFNPVLQFGLTRFLEKCRRIGIQGLIIPDLNLEVIEERYAALFESYGIPQIHLITPQTSNDRILRIATHSKNSFIYLVSQNAITGSAVDLSLQGDRYKEIKALCGDVPLIMGFGIKSKDDVERAIQYADGAIIGSAFITAAEDRQEIAFLEALKIDSNHRKDLVN